MSTRGGHPALGELRTVGERRIARQAERGGVSLHLPNQEVVAGDHGYDVVFEAPLADRALERADLAADRHGRGRAHAERRDRAAADAAAAARSSSSGSGRSARGLGVDWPKRTHDYASILAGLDPARPSTRP